MAILNSQVDVKPCGTGIPSKGSRSIPVASRRISARPALPALPDLLSEASQAHQCRCNNGIFSLGEIPGHNFSATDDIHQVKRQPDLSLSDCHVGEAQLLNSWSPAALSRDTGHTLWWP